MCIIWNTVKKMFEDVRPFDWLMLVVEMLVLVLIAYEVIAEGIHRRHKRNGAKRIMAFLAEGQLLHDTAPQRVASDDQANAWIEDVNNWIIKVQAFLAKDAKQAVAVFSQHTIGPRYSLKVHLQAENWFYELDSRLKSLRAIMEKPDVYF